MNTGASRPAGRCGGLTLVEVLISLGLASLLLVGLISALFAFGRSSVRVEERLDRIEEMRLLSEFLRFSLGTVADSTHFDHHEARAEGFKGSRSEIRWIGALPARHGVGGLHRLRLHLDEHSAAGTLILQYQPFSGQDSVPEWHGVRAHPLLYDVVRFNVAFKPSAEGELPADAWLDTWDLPSELPELVALSIVVDGRAWPELSIRLRPLPAPEEFVQEPADDEQ